MGHWWSCSIHSMTMDIASKWVFICAYSLPRPTRKSWLCDNPCRAVCSCCSFKRSSISNCGRVSPRLSACDIIQCSICIVSLWTSSDCVESNSVIDRITGGAGVSAWCTKPRWFLGWMNEDFLGVSDEVVSLVWVSSSTNISVSSTMVLVLRLATFESLSPSATDKLRAMSLARLSEIFCILRSLASSEKLRFRFGVLTPLPIWYGCEARGTEWIE